MSILLYIVGGILLILLLLLGLAWATEWKPADEEVIHTSGDISVLPDTLRILTWNTGYAGLGDDMDFFLDGGKRTRGSRERTEENLRRITKFLASCDADIILLQEVDRDSRRSYRVDQFARYQSALPDYHGYFALNYKSAFVPAPLRDPMGRVESGVAIFSRIPPAEVVRHQYRSGFSFPMRLFNLKRCWLAAGFRSEQGRVWVAVTHNTAFDSGTMRRAEVEQLDEWMGREAGKSSRTIVGGDWNQNPPGYTPSARETDDPYFSPRPMPDNGRWGYDYDPSSPTMRYLYEPLRGETTRSVIDFFVTNGFRCIGVNTIELGFKNSDHNPVVATFIACPRK